MKILILGAAGQISRILTDKLIKETNHDIVLYARQGDYRLKAKSKKQTSRDSIRRLSGIFKTH
ncbi:hypothetical protein MZM54_31555 [[Brevibacterium] frigoritolerans]|nr:hypothetical protein [Peribacillus frigoritolerans]